MIHKVFELEDTTLARGDGAAHGHVLPRRRHAARPDPAGPPRRTCTRRVPVYEGSSTTSSASSTRRISCRTTRACRPTSTCARTCTRPTSCRSPSGPTRCCGSSRPRSSTWPSWSTSTAAPRAWSRSRTSWRSWSARSADEYDEPRAAHPALDERDLPRLRQAADRRPEHRRRAHDLQRGTSTRWGAGCSTSSAACPARASAGDRRRPGDGGEGRAHPRGRGARRLPRPGTAAGPMPDAAGRELRASAHPRLVAWLWPRRSSRPPRWRSSPPTGCGCATWPRRATRPPRATSRRSGSPERVLSTAMMGVTIAHIVASAVATCALLPPGSAAGLARGHRRPHARSCWSSARSSPRRWPASGRPSLILRTVPAAPAAAAWLLAPLVGVANAARAARSCGVGWATGSAATSSSPGRSSSLLLQMEPDGTPTSRAGRPR